MSAQRADESGPKPNVWEQIKIELRQEPRAEFVP